MKSTVISQIMRNLKNKLKPGGELAVKIMTNNGEVNPLHRIGIHKYKAENY